MLKTSFLPVTALTALLAGCVAPPPPPAPVVAAPAPIAPLPTQMQGVAGLETREPDLCGAESYKTALAQSGTVIPTLGITKDYRVVEYRGIEPQDYDPNRIVFRLDASGNIYNVDCG